MHHPNMPSGPHGRYNHGGHGHGGYSQGGYGNNQQDRLGWLINGVNREFWNNELPDNFHPLNYNTTPFMGQYGYYIDGMTRKTLQDNADKNVLRMFMFNVYSNNHYHNDAYMELLSHLGDFVEFSSCVQNRDPMDLIPGCVGSMLKWKASKNTETFPELLGYVDQNMVNEIRSNCYEMDRVSRDVQNFFSQQNHQPQGGYGNNYNNPPPMNNQGGFRPIQQQGAYGNPHHNQQNNVRYGGDGDWGSGGKTVTENKLQESFSTDDGWGNGRSNVQFSQPVQQNVPVRSEPDQPSFPPNPYPNNIDDFQWRFACMLYPDGLPEGTIITDDIDYILYPENSIPGKEYLSTNLPLVYDKNQCYITYAVVEAGDTYEIKPVRMDISKEDRDVEYEDHELNKGNIKPKIDDDVVFGNLNVNKESIAVDLEESGGDTVIKVDEMTFACCSGDAETTYIYELMDDGISYDPNKNILDYLYMDVNLVNVYGDDVKRINRKLDVHDLDALINSNLDCPKPLLTVLRDKVLTYVNDTLSHSLGIDWKLDSLDEYPLLLTELQNESEAGISDELIRRFDARIRSNLEELFTIVDDETTKEHMEKTFGIINDSDGTSAIDTIIVSSKVGVSNIPYTVTELGIELPVEKPTLIKEHFCPKLFGIVKGLTERMANEDVPRPTKLYVKTVDGSIIRVHTNMISKDSFSLVREIATN